MSTLTRTCTNLKKSQAAVHVREIDVHYPLGAFSVSLNASFLAV